MEARLAANGTTCSQPPLVAVHGDDRSGAKSRKSVSKRKRARRDHPSEQRRLPPARRRKAG